MMSTKRVLTIGAFAALCISLVVILGIAGRSDADPAMTPQVRSAATEAGFEVTFDGTEVTQSPFIDKDGNSLTLADWKGKVVLVNLWATWCAPCLEEMPSLDRLARARRSSDFDVLAISVDRGGMSKVSEFYDRTGVEALQRLVDPTSKLALGLKAQGLPITIVLDRQGREVARFTGPAEWDGPEQLAFLDRMIAAGS